MVYKPAFIIIKEAARAIKIDYIMSMVFYKPFFTLLIGDD